MSIDVPLHWLLSAQVTRWLVVSTLLLTIPAFYLELEQLTPSIPAGVAYFIAAVALGYGGRRLHNTRHKPLGVLATMLIIGLTLAAVLPSSAESSPALTLRLVTAVLTLVYLVWSLQHLLERGSLPALLTLALTVLLMCGAGFWWLEPRATTLGDGLWLAFTTAATVGFGDIVPSTPASKIFSVFVVLLGYGVLSLVTAAIAAMWVESSEMRLERHILADLNTQIGSLRSEILQLRAELAKPTEPGACTPPHGAPVPPLLAAVPADSAERSAGAAPAALDRQGKQPLEDQRVDQLERQA